MWIKCGDELNTCLKNVHQIFLPWKKFSKYLYFSNCIFTMMSAPVKKVILRFFSRHEVIYLWVKFQVSLTPSTGFLPANTTFFTNIWREYFFPNILRVFDQPEVEFSKSGQNWANTRPLLLKTFESSNCVDRHIVQWRGMSVFICIFLLNIQSMGMSFFICTVLLLPGSPCELLTALCIIAESC